MSEPKLVMRKESPPGRPDTLFSRYAGDLEKMKTEAGEWFLFLEFAEPNSRQKAHQARNSFVRHAKGFEFLTRTSTLYARYVGEA